MRKRGMSFLALAVLTVLIPLVAYAHTGVGNTAGLARGFMHPITGIDHVLAMVMVGVFAWQLGGRALWLVPTTFVLVMAIGGALGVAGIGMPFVETGITLSVIVLGAIVALGIKARVAVAIAVVGLFATFHGHAHGSEMPGSATGIAYGLGFMIGTALLHIAGIGLGFMIGRTAERQDAIVVRTTGAAAALAGIAILTGLI